MKTFIEKYPEFKYTLNNIGGDVYSTEIEKILDKHFVRIIDLMKEQTSSEFIEKKKVKDAIDKFKKEIKACKTKAYIVNVDSLEKELGLE